MRTVPVLLSIGLFLIIIIMAASLLSGTEHGANVAVIPITGAITVSGDTGWGTRGTSSTDIARYIREADENPTIKIIVLEINSPGGSAVASDEIARAVEHADTHVVAWIREVGASGAYWAASEADHIIANRMSITGSVGVLASYLELADLLQEYNVTYQRITGGTYKDTGSPFAKLTEEERALLQAKVNQVHDLFLTDVQENRGLTDEQLDTVRTGIFFLGTEAHDLGLVDAVGGRQEVEAYLEEHLGTKPVYRRYERSRSFFQELASVTTPTIPTGLRITS